MVLAGDDYFDVPGLGGVDSIDNEEERMSAEDNQILCPICRESRLILMGLIVCSHCQKAWQVHEFIADCERAGLRKTVHMPDRTVTIETPDGVLII